MKIPKQYAAAFWLRGSNLIWSLNNHTWLQRHWIHYADFCDFQLSCIKFDFGTGRWSRDVSPHCRSCFGTSETPRCLEFWREAKGNTGNKLRESTSRGRWDWWFGVGIPNVPLNTLAFIVTKVPTPRLLNWPLAFRSACTKKCTLVKEVASAIWFSWTFSPVLCWWSLSPSNVQEVKGGLDERRQHPAKLAFQGIRNFINQETWSQSSAGCWLSWLCGCLVDLARNDHVWFRIALNMPSFDRLNDLINMWCHLCIAAQVPQPIRWHYSCIEAVSHMDIYELLMGMQCGPKAFSLSAIKRRIVMAFFFPGLSHDC